MDKHRNIRFDGIPNHIIYLQGNTVGTIHTNHRTIVLNTNVKSAASCVSKGNHLFAKVCNNRRLEFDSFALNKCHKAPPVVFLITIIIIIVIIVIFVNLYSCGD